MSTYKALVLEALDKPVALKQLPTPPVTPGSVLVQPLYAGFKSYLRALFTGKAPFPLSLPLTPGTSCVARVEAVGPDATAIKAGDIVWVDGTITARDDPDTQILLALHGGATPASRQLMTGVWRNGAFAEKLLAPLENCFVLAPSLFQPKAAGGLGLSYQELANLSTVLVPYGGLESAHVSAGTTLIVAPATGKFSGGAVLVALAMGAKVIAAGRNAEGLKKLERFPGAEQRLKTVQLASDVEKDTAALMAATGGRGAHVYIDFSPTAASGPTAASHITSCMRVLKRGGQAVLAGGVMSNIEINYGLLVFKNITVMGNFMYERKQIEKLLRMIENGNLLFGKQVGMTGNGVYGLEDKLEEVLDMAEKGTGWGGDVLLAPNGKL